MFATRVLVLGSGPMRIGEGGEFDYAGVSCIKALRSLGCEVHVINQNPASLMQVEAQFCHFVSLDAASLMETVDIFKPQALLPICGGQRSLNLVMECESELKDRAVRVLGSPLASVRISEERHQFSQFLRDHGFKSIPEYYGQDKQLAREFLQIHKAAVLRQDRCLGGEGARVLTRPEELELWDAKIPLHLCAWLEGYREIELEILRDREGNSFCVCGLENLDPVGIHTGDSVVMTPIHSVCDRQWQAMRRMALQIADKLGVVGACNVQVAYHPDTGDLLIVEVNLRLSRSSALASRATQTPIAYLATMLCMNHLLSDLSHPYDPALPAMLEPALDYVAVKVPWFESEKLRDFQVKRGVSMISLGESLGFGNSFAQAFSDANSASECPDLSPLDWPILPDWELLPDSGFAIANPQSQSRPMSGCAYIPGTESLNATTDGRPSILFVGNGPYRMGIGLEFDFNLTLMMRRARELGYFVILLNNNPAAVSLDREESDRLHIRSISPANFRILLNGENPDFVCLSASAPYGNSLSRMCPEQILLGSSRTALATCEERAKFCQFIDESGLSQPAYRLCRSEMELREFLFERGSRVICRQDYKMAGSQMLTLHLKELEFLPMSYPCLATQFVSDTIEVNLEVISSNKGIHFAGYYWHRDQDGFHGSDVNGHTTAIEEVACLEPLLFQTLENLRSRLNLVGAWNLQVLLLQGQILILELNLRASRSLPFFCAVSGLNLPALAMDAMLGQPLSVTSHFHPLKAASRIPVFSRNFRPRTVSSQRFQMLSTGEILKWH